MFTWTYIFKHTKEDLNESYHLIEFIFQNISLISLTGHHVVTVAAFMSQIAVLPTSIFFPMTSSVALE